MNVDFPVSVIVYEWEGVSNVWGFSRKKDMGTLCTHLCVTRSSSFLPPGAPCMLFATVLVGSVNDILCRLVI